MYLIFPTIIANSQDLPTYLNRQLFDEGLFRTLAFLLNVAETQLLVTQGPPALLVRVAQLGVEVSRFFRPGVSLDIDLEDKDEEDWVDVGRMEDEEGDNEEGDNEEGDDEFM